MSTYKKGKIVKGTVTGITDYGIFVSMDEYYSGLIHISEISNLFVKDISDYVTLGEEIYVEILDVNEEESHLRLSIKNIHYKIDKVKRKRKIIETSLGFKTLSYKLSSWIDDGIERYSYLNSQSIKKEK